jgi:transcription elongation factor GreB
MLSGGPMSKAFTSEETAPDPVVVRPRAPLPLGVPNYVTRRGLQALQRELAELERERVTAEQGSGLGPEEQARAAALATRVTELAGRIHGAVLVDPPAGPTDEVRFGAIVTVVARDAEGRERRLQIVGVDEANGREGKVAFVAPIARALLGRRRGELATLRSPRGEEELEVVDIEYDEPVDEHLR